MRFDQDLCKNLWYELNPRVRCALGNVLFRAVGTVVSDKLFLIICYLDVASNVSHDVCTFARIDTCYLTRVSIISSFSRDAFFLLARDDSRRQN